MIFIKKPNFDCAMLVANLLTKLRALRVLNIISVESQFENLSPNKHIKTEDLCVQPVAADIQSKSVLVNCLILMMIKEVINQVRQTFHIQHFISINQSMQTILKNVC